jgi:hypothetical protein
MDGCQEDSIYTDFSKAFNKVRHLLFLDKMSTDVYIFVEILSYRHNDKAQFYMCLKKRTIKIGQTLGVTNAIHQLVAISTICEQYNVFMLTLLKYQVCIIHSNTE